MTEYLIFEAGEHTLGVAVSHVREVVRAATLSRPVNQSSSVVGLLNLRGGVVPVIDLQSVLGVAVPPLSPSDFLVVLCDQQDRLCAVRSCSEVRLDSTAELVGDAATSEAGDIVTATQQLRVGSLIIPLLNPNVLTELAIAGNTSPAESILPAKKSREIPGGSA